MFFLSCYVIQRETTLTISDSLRQSQQSKPNCESGSLSTTEITDITRFEKKNDLQGPDILNHISHYSVGCLTNGIFY